MPAYFDAGDLAEDERIDLIGATVMKFPEGKKTAFIVDDIPGTPDRYIKKLTERFPGVVVAGRMFGPVAKTVTVTVMRRRVDVN